MTNPPDKNQNGESPLYTRRIYAGLVFVMTAAFGTIFIMGMLYQDDPQIDEKMLVPFLVAFPVIFVGLMSIFFLVKCSKCGTKVWSYFGRGPAPDRDKYSSGLRASVNYVANEKDVLKFTFGASCPVCGAKRH